MKYRMLLIVLVSFFSTHVLSQCDPVSDSLALVALYNSTDGPNWTNNDGWLEPGVPIGDWHGVWANMDGCVLSLVLQSNNLNGELPKEIGDFKAIVVLWLSENEIYGPIPNQIGKLSLLQSLVFSDNQIEGEIPPEIGGLSNLESLKISFNNLKGNIPKDLGDLTELQTLDLSYNSLTGGIPSSFSNLINLEYLSLENNALQDSLPDWLELLNMLEFLRLSNNAFSGTLPQSIGQITSLKYLGGNNNKLSGEIPDGLGNLVNLQTLWLQENNFMGCIPNTLSDLCSSEVYLWNNPLLPWSGDFMRFCAGEPQIGAPCDDQNPYTSNDTITVDCECRGSCTENDSLALVAFYHATDGPNWENKSGWLQQGVNLEDWFGVGVNEDGCVENISLRDNLLNGQLPSKMGDLRSLEHLDLRYNKLNGEIPLEFQNLINLNYLNLSYNNISGTIPSYIGSFLELVFLDLQGNSFNGSIPEEIWNLSKLSTLALCGNALTGTISPSIGNLTSLSEFSLCGNALEGALPNELYSLTKLKDIRIHWNSLSGKISPFIGNLDQLEEFWIFGNKFEGKIPNEIGNLELLKNLKFHDNNFSGCFPMEIKLHCDLGFSQAPVYPGFSAYGNPGLPWNGDMQRFCSGEEQISAPCDDLDLSTEFDRINSYCECAGTPCDAIRDSLALVDLYNSTDGNNWTQKWDLAAPMSTWVGVELHPSGCLKTLNLTNRNLNGTLPFSINQLELAIELTISQNENLDGPLPLGLNRLKFLKVLDVSQNALEDGIPPDLGDIGELEELRINNNLFNGCLPAELSQLENLVIFDASNNQFDCTDFPTELITLCSLEELYLENNNDVENLFDAFCEGGENAAQCNFILDSLYCIPEIYDIAESLECGEYETDSTQLLHATIGLVDINEVPYAYIRRHFQDSYGSFIDTVTFIGCAFLVCETCVVTADTVVCRRDVLDEERYSILDFEEFWDCTQEPPECFVDYIEEYNGSMRGNGSGIHYEMLDEANCQRQVARFRRQDESRVEYELGWDLPREGTLEWWLKVDSGYDYDQGELHEEMDTALIFSTCVRDAHVVWPGNSWLSVTADGDILFEMTTEKFQVEPAYRLIAEDTDFRFGQWHALGVSYGDEGMYILLDGEIVASEPVYMQKMGTGGNFHEPTDVPTLGELWPSYSVNNSYESGFEGYVDRFRITENQQSWSLAFDVEDCKPIGTEEMQESHFVVYPNPAKESVLIKGSKSIHRFRFSIFNLLGEKIMEKEIQGNEYRLDISLFKNACFIIQIENPKGYIMSFKLLKN